MADESNNGKLNKINGVLIGLILLLLIFFLGMRYIEKKSEKEIEVISQLLSSDAANPGNDKSDNEKININTAGIYELMSLNGIGKSKAQAILDYRLKYGDFGSIEEIKNVNGIGEQIFEDIKDDITV